MNLLPLIFLLLSSTTAEHQISVARHAIEVNRKSPQAFNDLAAAFCARAEESGELDFYLQAQEALNHSLQIAPLDYAAQKTQIVIMLGQRRSAEALKAARKVNRIAPDDTAVWGFLSEANLQLGNLGEAEKAAQWMFDLRPANTAAYVPAAKVREAYGDIEGAIDFLNEAYRRTPEGEQENRARILTESARLYLSTGDVVRAQSRITEALQLYPSYYAALKLSSALQSKQTSH